VSYYKNPNEIVNFIIYQQRGMNRIKETLKSQGRTQKWFASKMGKTENTVSLWSLNKIQPSVEDLYKIAELLSVNVKDLLVDNKESK
jgi:transcriptional regulator with XRE-family HTH domain